MKRLFVTFTLDAPLGTRDPELLVLVEKGLEPLLALSERLPRLKVQLAISGVVFDFLLEQRSKLLPRLTKLLREGSIAPLLTVHYDPQLSFATQSELETQLRLSIGAWEQLSVATPRTVWLAQGATPALLAALRSVECPLILAPSTSLIGLPNRGERLPLTQLHQLPNDLLLLPVEAMRSALTSSARVREVTNYFEDQGHDSTKFIFAPQIPLDLELLQGESHEPFHRTLERLFLSAGDDFTIEFELTADLIKHFFPIVSGLSSSLPSLDEFSFAPVAEVGERLKTPRERNLLFHRLLQLAEEIEGIPAFIAEHANEFANNARYEKAIACVARAHNCGLFLDSGEHTVANFSLRKQLYRAMLTAQVEIDAIRNPEVDPSIGWARFDSADYDQDGEQEAIVDTQLVRLYFKPSQGANLVAFDYKPRKVNFVNHFDPQGAAECCTFSLLKCDIEQETVGSLRSVLPLLKHSHGASTVKLTRKTLDMIGLRFAVPTTAIEPTAPETQGRYQAELVNHLLMKSEIGAHLNNATTGFSMEYWLEGEAPPPAGLQLVQQWSMMLPSGDNRVLSVRPLLSAAGTHDKALSCDEDLIVRPSDAPGGLHGLRLIDGLDNLVMDLRSAKPVSAIAVLSIAGTPQTDGTLRYSGTTVLFFYEARRFFRDDRANTLFLSIK